MKDDIILYEVYDAIFHPDDYVRDARKHHIVAWVLGIILWSLIGILQMLVLVLMFIPAKIFKWALTWRY